MTLLVAVTWDPGPWIERFRRLLPDRKTVLPGEPFDRRTVHYVATWGPKPGSLSGLPNLQVIFSLGAGVDHLIAYPDLPDVPIPGGRHPHHQERQGVPEEAVPA